MNDIQKTNNLIQELLDIYHKNSISFCGVIPPKASLKQSYLECLKQIEQLRGRAVLYPYLGSGRGKGVFVELLDGSVKMDLLGGIGVQILGHAHKELQSIVLKSGLSNILMQGHLTVNKEYLELSRKLVELAKKNSCLKYTWLSTSGSMAGENALKISRQKNTNRRKILAFDKAFAGRTTMMSEITSNPKIKEGLPVYDEVLRIPFYDPKNPEKSLNILKEHLKTQALDISVFVFEIILGEGGYVSAPREFFVSLFEECRKYKIAIWADEVQTFLRTGYFFAYEKLNLGPYIDICTVGKGLQLAATFFTEEYKPRPGLISSTFSSTTPALAMGLKTLEILEKDYIGEKGIIKDIQKQFIELFEFLVKKSLIKDYNVFGLMTAFSLNDSSAENTSIFTKTLFKNGVIALPCGKNPMRVRFLIPAVIHKKEIKQLKSILIKTLLEV